MTLAVIPFALALPLSPAFSEIVFLGAIHPSLKSISRKGEPKFMQYYSITSAMKTASVLRIVKSRLRTIGTELASNIDKSNWVTNSSWITVLARSQTRWFLKLREYCPNLCPVWPVWHHSNAEAENPIPKSPLFHAKGYEHSGDSTPLQICRQFRATVVKYG
jgi:hypothetical protein